MSRTSLDSQMAIYIICVGPKMVDLHPFHIASFLEAQLDTMVFVGHGQTTPCKEMGPLPTQGLTFGGSMVPCCCNLKE